MTIKDEFVAALNKVLENQDVGVVESFELLLYLNAVSAEIARQLQQHFIELQEKSNG